MSQNTRENQRKIMENFVFQAKRSKKSDKKLIL